MPTVFDMPPMPPTEVPRAGVAGDKYADLLTTQPGWPKGVPYPRMNRPPRVDAARPGGFHPKVQGLLERLAQREAGFANDPDDTPTNFGVTQETLTDWLGRPASIEEVANLDYETAKEILAGNYFHRPGIDQLPDDIQEQVFDQAVFMGPGQAVRNLQRALNAAGASLPISGAIGPKTIQAAIDMTQALGPTIGELIADEARTIVPQIIEQNPKKKKFEGNWYERISRLRPPHHPTPPRPRSPQ